MVSLLICWVCSEHICADKQFCVGRLDAARASLDPISSCSPSYGQLQHQPFFGLTVVTCERGDIRQSPDGLFIYDEDGKREIHIPKGIDAREAELQEFYEGIVNDRPIFHDGRWGQATLEVCLAILQSAAERQEVTLSLQVPVPNVS